MTPRDLVNKVIRYLDLTETIKYCKIEIHGQDISLSNINNTNLRLDKNFGIRFFNELRIQYSDSSLMEADLKVNEAKEIIVKINELFTDFINSHLELNYHIIELLVNRSGCNQTVYQKAVK